MRVRLIINIMYYKCMFSHYIWVDATTQVPALHNTVSRIRAKFSRFSFARCQYNSVVTAGQFTSEGFEEKHTEHGKGHCVLYRQLRKLYILFLNIFSICKILTFIFIF